MGLELPREERSVPAVTVGLFALALVLLGLGRYIQFDDESGFGSEKWIGWFGGAVAVDAAALLLLAVIRERARPPLAVGLLLLAACVVVLSMVSDGFRF